MGISTVLVFSWFLFLPGDQIVAESRKSYAAGGGVFPFHAGREVSNLQENENKNAASHKILANEESETKSNIEPEAAGIPEHIEAPVESNILPLETLDKVEDAPKTNLQLNRFDEKNNINIQEINLNNNVESVAEVQSERDHTIIEKAVQDPMILPDTKGLTIDDFLKNISTAIVAQKQHFHGATNERQIAVVAAFKHSWDGYRKNAWGLDNLKPISQTGYDWFGLGLTLVDSLDTMYIMGLEDEFLEATNWVNEKLNFDKNRDVNLFEVTIRVLGGLLSAYHLSGDKVFLKKSVELGNRLLPCFLSPSGIPYSDVNLASLSAHSPKWSPDSSTSEVTTIQLEFRDLSRSTNVPIYERLVETVNEKVHALDKNNGLVPIFINANTGTFRNYATISLGARGDSYYEYLLKQWIQTGRKENDYLVLDYLRSIDGVMTQLMRRTPKEQHVFIGELINGKEFKPKMDHLTCYLPGTLILGHKYGMPDSHLILARDLLETCYQTYMKQPTQLAPEISYFAVSENEEHDIYVKPNDAHNLLRPEFIESLYYFYALTGNRTYQDMGWNIFQAFQKHTKVANGYTSIGNVKNVLNTRLRDVMESFWLGETLKYFYLLFSDNRKEIDLEKWVFNSEAHPLPIRKH
ncbi:endoplasmic reticulum mannosyl-oligosaccharide 1,2-alpha-mannosidase-like [Teleopsis dalmanni]|uniref:endoplasmic reticulum mannosyl-oligosaccharide 1,2-alpha-mannosidase-like n=1 Tax=Teleopsis dalmanni TaxID=139649 RepID=UPI0018CCC4D2|nr:endoplasmic reticulum mannosyl-oligosaccharide 1,2-alpha-mannosidase-like [Teleopsis dalmanni]